MGLMRGLFCARVRCEPLYANGHAELAQLSLRGAIVETTTSSYSDIQAAETAQQVDELLDK